MLDQKGFDSWAVTYDHDVKHSDESSSFPFAGYSSLMRTVAAMVDCTGHPRILDIGFGTGTLLRYLHSEGCVVYGVDFSEQMVRTAGEKIPEGHFFQSDFSNGLPEELSEERFDFIISTYALHHLRDSGKTQLLTVLARDSLSAGGHIIIGDVAFETAEQLESCRRENAEDWDSDEYYFVASRIIPQLERAGLNCKFKKLSVCAGVLTIENHK